MADGDAVAARLDADRKGLLDLTLRNPLLNYRTRARGLEFVGESSAALYRTLVVDGKAMSFLHDPRAAEPEMAAKDAGAEAEPSEAEVAPPPTPLVTDQGDLRLQTGLPAEALESRLLAIYLNARSSIEEQGVNTLHLALGMLRWFGEDASKPLRAPLVLVPVALERSGARERFRLKHAGEEPGGNLSMAEKLRAEHRIELPPFPEDETDLGGYFDAVAAAVSGHDQWEVARDSAALGFFSFGKFLMYRDLDAEGWPPESRPGDHPIVRSLLGQGFSGPVEPDDDGQAVGDDPRIVVDADGSQARAIRDVAERKTLVIQGPPGTGKSQTITNLIAGAIAEKRTVLFVAEKLAALEVVKRRLDATGLGDACLELHSRKASKKAVLAELRRTLELGRPRAGNSEEDGRLLDELRGRLDGYAEAINAPVGPSGVAPHDAIGELLKLADEVPPDDLPRPDLAGLDSWSGYDYRRRLALVEQLQARLPPVGIPDHHPFRGSRRTLFHPAEGETLRALLSEARQSVAKLREAAGRLAGILRLNPPGAKFEVIGLLATARKAAQGVRLHGIDPRDEEWSTRRTEARDLIEAGLELGRIRERHESTLLPDAWDQDLSEDRRELNLRGRHWWRFLDPTYRRADRRLAGLCRREPPGGLEAKLGLLDDVIEARRHREAIARLGPVGARLFGPRWQGEASHWRGLAKVASWVTRLRGEARSGKVPSGLLDFLAGPVDVGELHEASRSTRDALEALPTNLGGLATFLQTDESLVEMSFADLEGRLDLWANREDTLRDLAAWNHSAETCRRDGLAGVVALAGSWPGAADHLSRAFRRRWFEGLLEVARTGRPSLAGFDGRGHDREVEAFRDLDRKALVHARGEAATVHWQGLPRQGGGGQLGDLRREMEKKSRHWPIRKLLSHAWNPVQKLKPVFLMSPLSVAAYLAPGMLKFDLVIFDEASQVRPVDALGALLRGGQAVVVGDSRQLPPTQFFDRLVAGDDGDDDHEPTSGDVESILGLFVAQGAPERMLRWHYRSRHESLIAVSNREFYDGRLVVFPSPDVDRRDSGLVLRHLPGNAYDRGGTRTNPGEAEAVALAVMAHAAEQSRKPPESRRTLGVAAFSVAQARAILDRLEKLRRDAPSHEPFFAEGGAEPFFVKNLESVQGDERDVIFLSLGYGRTADGSMAMAFGPLNLDGGERRLNVLITRARVRCEVFANFTAADLDLTKTQSRGVRSLKAFLAYAETGRLEGATPVEEAAEPPFEAALRSAIARAGFSARPGVGSSIAKIDLAVEDPGRPGRYVLGIESDGPAYREARSARDRDRLRPRVLELLGWHLHRAWSPDWDHDVAGSTARLVEAIERALRPASPPPLPTPVADPIVDREGPEDEIAKPGAASAESIPPYRLAAPTVETGGRELPEIGPERVADWAAEVVAAEGPVHAADVARRIAEAAGVKRIGPRIQSTLDQALDLAATRGQVRREGDFLWPVGVTEPPLRDRSGLPAASRKLEWVAPGEIGRAIERVVADALGMEPEAILPAACRLLGFPRIGDDNRRRVEAIRDDLLARGRLARRGDHLVLAQASPSRPIVEDSGTPGPGTTGADLPEV